MLGNHFPGTRGRPEASQHDDILRYVQQAPDDISWTIDQAENLLALKKDSAPDPDGIPHGEV